jgi:hypothetical protein
MNNNNVKLDMENLKKLAPLCLGIGAGLGVLWSVGIYLGGLWNILLLAAWAVSGGLYANTILKSGSGAEYVNLAVNGAILAAISEVVFDILSGVIYSMQVGEVASLFSVSTFLEAIIIGAIAAVAWYAYQTNNKK